MSAARGRNPPRPSPRCRTAWVLRGGVPSGARGPGAHACPAPLSRPPRPLARLKWERRSPAGPAAQAERRWAVRLRGFGVHPQADAAGTGDERGWAGVAAGRQARSGDMRRAQAVSALRRRLFLLYGLLSDRHSPLARKGLTVWHFC